jgi:mono/diheme cytochrome c family protein
MERRRRSLALLAALSLGLIASETGAAEPQPLAGRALALATCAYCHVVAQDQAFEPPLQPRGPAFAAVANNPAFTAKKLRTFLLTVHRDIAHGKAMPSQVLTNAQINDIVSYIQSQREPRDDKR